MASPATRLTDLAALSEAAEWLKAIAHPHRLRIFQMLVHSRYTVGELAEACGVSSPMASEHLRLLQRCGLLDSDREGRRVYYHIVESHVSQLLKCIEQRYGSKK